MRRFKNRDYMWLIEQGCHIKVEIVSIMSVEGVGIKGFQITVHHRSIETAYRVRVLHDIYQRTNRPGRRHYGMGSVNLAFMETRRRLAYLLRQAKQIEPLFLDYNPFS